MYLKQMENIDDGGPVCYSNQWTERGDLRGEKLKFAFEDTVSSR